MYLRGSKWRMTRRRRRRSNPFIIALLVVVIGALVYVNQVVVPATPPLFIPTPTPTRSPESIVNEARDLFNAGNLAQAIEAYEQAILVDATNPSIYLELARTQIFSGDYESALTNAENALLLSPNNAMGHALRGWAMYFTDDVLAAEAEYKQALSLEPNNVFALSYYAELAAFDGRFDLAGDLSRQASNLARDVLEVRRARGIVLSLTGNYLEAIQEYRAALALNDNIADLHLRLGNNYAALDDYDQAVQEYGIADTLNPADPTPDTLIALTYLKVGQFAKAIQYAEQAVSNSPDDPELHGNLGIALYRNLEYNRAINELKIAVENIPLVDEIDAVQYYTIYGYALLRSDRCEEAVPVFYQLLSTVPDNETAVFNAQEGISLCQESLGIPITEPPEESATAEPTEGP